MIDDKKESIIIAVVIIAFIIGIATTIGVTVKTNKENRKVSTTQSVEKEEASKANAAEDNAAAENANGSSASNGSNSGNSSNSGNKPASGGSHSGGSSNSGNKPAPKPTEPAKPVSSYLTASQKQWVIDNYFGKFPEHGADTNFKIVEKSSSASLVSTMSFTQDNYRSVINGCFYEEDPGMGPFIEIEAKGAKMVFYHFYEENGKTVLDYAAIK